MRYPDMSDEDLMEKMALHVQPLLEWASWNKHDFMRYLKRDIATEYGVAKALELKANQPKLLPTAHLVQPPMPQPPNLH